MAILDNAIIGGDEPVSSQNNTFLITGGVTFGPRYVPERISIGKKRNLSRKESFCGGEDVDDAGSKNREIHLSGPLLESELNAFNELLNYGRKLDVITPGWSGEAYVKSGNLEGPQQFDPVNKEYIYTYKIDLVSSGANEPDEREENGIISDGN